MMLNYDFDFQEPLEEETLLSELRNLDVIYGKKVSEPWPGNLNTSYSIISKNPKGHLYFTFYPNNIISVNPYYYFINGFTFLRMLSVFLNHGIKTGGFHFSSTFMEDDGEEKMFIKTKSEFENLVLPRIKSDPPFTKAFRYASEKYDAVKEIPTVKVFQSKYEDLILKQIRRKGHNPWDPSVDVRGILISQNMQG